MPKPIRGSAGSSIIDYGDGKKVHKIMDLEYEMTRNKDGTYSCRFFNLRQYMPEEELEQRKEAMMKNVSEKMAGHFLDY